MGTGGQRHTLATLFPKKRDPVSITQVPWWLQSYSGQVQQISPPRGFDQRMSKSVAIPSTLSRPTANNSML